MWNIIRDGVEEFPIILLLHGRPFVPTDPPRETGRSVFVDDGVWLHSIRVFDIILVNGIWNEK